MAFSVDAMQALVKNHWPGNIRALRHAIERAVILSGSTEFQPGDFQIENNYEPTTNKRIAAGISEDSSPELNLEQLEKSAIEQALEQNRYNISYAAKDLGLTRATLYRRMEKHGL